MNFSGVRACSFHVTLKRYYLSRKGVSKQQTKSQLVAKVYQIDYQIDYLVYQIDYLYYSPWTLSLWHESSHRHQVKWVGIPVSQ